ncbi:c-binding -like [Pelobates cultripes]|uniref:C-binding -like n=1 Tax=Pelobates cultripes TaxID=61616 RepID=A0AAD1T2X5_PELCU|nr:c-binding -like [Pelobates cultripes]
MAAGIMFSDIIQYVAFPNVSDQTATYRLSLLSQRFISSGATSRQSSKNPYNMGIQKREPKRWPPRFTLATDPLRNGLATRLGRAFITAFLQNGNSSFGHAELNISVTAFSTPTSVTVQLTNPPTTWSLLLSKGETVTIQLPPSAEMIGNALFNSSVLITSDDDISVMCLNSKKSLSSSRIIAQPVHMLGKQYFIVTPNEEPYGFSNEFAVINYNYITYVQVFVRGSIIFQGRQHTFDVPLTLKLQPFQVLQLQSDNDLSGSMVSSDNPVAVLTGYSCMWKNNHCDHVYEQLYSVSNWGKQYIVQPLPFQYHRDFVFISASQVTQVNYISGPTQQNQIIQEGQVLKIPIRLSRPLAINANVSIQVMFYCTGGTAQGFLLDPFLISVPDTSRYCTEYQVQGLQGFINAVLITAKTESIQGIKFNKLNLQQINWRKIPGSIYSWTQYRYGRRFQSHSISHSGSVFSVVSVGLSSTQGSYGILGVCTKPRLYINHLFQIQAIQAINAIVGKIFPAFIYINVCSSHYRKHFIVNTYCVCTRICKSLKCRKKESCQFFQNNPVCVPDSEAYCRIWGDPHYYTFDGLSFDFQGTCTYTVAKTCIGFNGVEGDHTLPEFAVEAQNANHASQEFSYIAMVYVRFQKFNISIARSEVGYVTVNNVRWPLPLSLDSGRIQIAMTGFNVLMETDFMRVLFDWNTFLMINIPSSFSENVCGLCGNYNDKPEDDFQTPAGVLVSEVVEFGKSWKVTGLNDNTCSDDCNGPCEPTLPLNSTENPDLKSCDILSQEQGPFQYCYPVIDPKPFVKACTYDIVRNGGHKESLCQAINVYQVACQTLGIHVEEWRKTTDCAIVCPENSHYNSCGSACPATCFGRPSSCPSPCIETCECNPDSVLSQGKCVPKISCGCFLKGRHYPPKEVFWGEGHCNQKCSCNPVTRKVNCVNATCREGEQCVIARDMKYCRPMHHSTCSVYGDHHYITFDGAHYDFQGNCKYKLSGLCNKNKGLNDFQVNILKMKSLISKVSYIGSVWVNAYGVEIIFNRQNPGKAMEGWNSVILMQFGLKVTFDWQSEVTVTLPQSYSGAVCGLCGNFNGKPNDYLKMINGQIAENVQVFGQSWRTKMIVDGCGEYDSGKCAELPEMRQSQRHSYANCGILLNKSGPFRKCHSVVDPEVYFQNCISDSCFYKGRQAIFCQVITSYARACQKANGTLFQWRNETFCKTHHYELCSTGCPLTCTRMGSRPSCSKMCYEGCVCDEGYMLNGDRCTTVSGCGCNYNGNYYKVTEIFFPTNSCNKRCVCNPTGSVSCTPFACKPKEKCKIISGVRKCHPTEAAVCSATGDTHYNTFDGLNYRFEGSCCYLLAKSCAPGNPSIPDFSIGKNLNSPSHNFAFVCCYLMIQFYDIFERFDRLSTPGPDPSISQKYFSALSLLNDKVNGQYVNLPLHLWDKGVWAYQHGRRVVFRSVYGLQVSYDLAYEVLVKIYSNFYGQVCGLCGNYNGNINDEFHLPNGSLTKSAKIFGKAWRENTYGKDCSNTCVISQNKSTDCKHKRLYQGVKYCGRLLSLHGLFTSCHKQVNPQDYFNNCVVDLCHSGGNTKALCDNIQHYMTACQKAGVMHINWRNQDLCPLTCSINSHYEICSNSCMNSCAQITSPIECPNDCSEGCQCDTGYYLDVDNCVPLDSCGCVSDGRYYKIRETFLRNHCQENCTCLPNGVINCDAYSCTTGSVNGQYVNLPLHLWDKGVWAYQHGRRVVFRSVYGLQVSYDLAYEVLVKIYSNFYGQVCGLCGNNGNINDEFHLPNGSLTKSANIFGKAWLENTYGKDCSNTCVISRNKSTDCKHKRLYQGVKYCGRLLSLHGLFTTCHKQVNPQDYFNNCVVDLCHSGGNTKALCDNIQHYMTACQKAGVMHINWRNQDLCPLTCSINSHYEICSNSCMSSCAQMTSPIVCPNDCSEGCQCDTGYYLDVDNCVPLC